MLGLCVDLKKGRLSFVCDLTLRLLLLIPEQLFDVELDIIAALDYMLLNNYISRQEHGELQTRLLQQVDLSTRARCQRFVRTLIEWVGFQNSIDTLSATGAIELAGSITRGLHQELTRRERQTSVGADIPNVRLIIRQYIRHKHSIDENIFRADLLESLCRRSEQKFATITDQRELQKESDLYIVIVRLRVQLSENLSGNARLISEMRRNLPGGVNTYYADLIYHGRHVLTAIQERDLQAVKNYADEVEMMCIGCSDASIRALFHHRMVFVYRKLFQKRPTVEIYMEILRHCDKGLRSVQNLDTDIKMFFTEFFLIKMCLTRMKINVDFTLADTEDIPTTAADRSQICSHLGHIEAEYLPSMRARGAMMFHVCKARAVESTDRRLAVEYIDRAMNLANDGLIFEERRQNLESYRRKVVENQTSD